MRRLLRVLTLLALCPPTTPAPAQDTERARLAVERLSLSESYAAEEQACKARFVVTACVDDVRMRRRAALKPLIARERSLDETERAQRALERLAGRAAKAEARPQADAAVVPQDATAERRSAPAAVPHEPLAARAAEDADGRALQAAERARLAARRIEALNALQAEVQRKSAERAAGGRKSAPLPLPPAASASH